jgi:hypothetical protein
VVQHRQLDHEGQLALHPEVQARGRTHRGGGGEEGPEERKKRLPRLPGSTARVHEQGEARSEERRRAVILLAVDPEAEDQPGEGEDAPIAGLEEAHQRQQRSRQDEECGGRVAVHLPVGKGPDAVEQQQPDAKSCVRRWYQAANEQKDHDREGAEFENDDPAGEQDRRLEAAEGESEEVKGAREWVARRIPVEHPALRHDVGELQHVSFVHHAEPAIEERELEAEGCEGDQQRPSGTLREAARLTSAVGLQVESAPAARCNGLPEPERN